MTAEKVPGCGVLLEKVCMEHLYERSTPVLRTPVQVPWYLILYLSPVRFLRAMRSQKLRSPSAKLFYQ